MKYKFLRFPEGKCKAVTFSYDDGSVHDLRLVEVLNKHNIKCTFNICSGRLNNNDGWSLNAQQVKENFIDAGHEVAIHGKQHMAIGTQRPIDGIREVLDCRLELEEIFGQIIRGLAYADSGIRVLLNGTTYETVREYLKDLDIAYARSLGNDNCGFMLPEDFYRWYPSYHHENPKLFDYINYFLGTDPNKLYSSNRAPWLFYLWGHAHEFHNNNNWEKLDQICEKLGGRDNIWYATNIEVCDYVKAFESLIFSADGRRIYNPTLKTVWIDIDGELYTIKSGETIFIENK